MHIFTYIDKDATIYERNPGDKLVATTQRQNQNTGLDSILELSKYKIDTTYYNSRILLKFNEVNLSASLAVHGKTLLNTSHSLKLYTSKVYEIPLKYDVYVHPVSESWDMGTGKSTDSPIIQDGVSWKYKDGYFKGSGSHWGTSSFNAITQYYQATGSTNFGGTYYEGHDEAATLYTHVQSFEYETGDLDIDISDTVYKWSDGVFDNEGLIVKRPATNETEDKPYGNLQFFSRDTHTIYVPRIDTKWDDSSFDTGSLSPIDMTKDITLNMKGIKSEYKQVETPKFKVTGRNRIPTKTYTTQSDYLTFAYLPSTTYYSVRDVSTDENVIDFDDYTKVSCDTNGNFFNFRIDTLQPERHYKFLFKVVSGSTTEVFDDDKFQFKVVR
jgi:hypothetical protein